nr:zinc finger, CCHC-type, retrotransposon Gag domain protein [Tanacetum cinerariifolium]
MREKSGKKVYKFLGGKSCAQCTVYSVLKRGGDRETREGFRTSFGPSDSGGNPPPVTIHTWLKRFNKQKPYSFEKVTAPVDAENWISHMEKIFDVMGCEDAFKTRLAVYKFEGDALAWWKAYKLAKGGDVWLITAKNFQWGLRKSTLNYLMCIPFTDVAQVANAARNYEILHERDDDDAERPDKR